MAKKPVKKGNGFDTSSFTAAEKIAKAKRASQIRAVSSTGSKKAKSATAKALLKANQAKKKRK